MIDDLSAAFRAGQLAAALQVYTHPAVLVVDDVGYLTYGTDAANMLFHVVNDRHRRRRAVIFEQAGDVLGESPARRRPGAGDHRSHP